MADPGNGHPDERVDITVLRGLCALIPLSLYCLYRASVRGCLDLIMGDEVVTRDFFFIFHGRSLVRNS